MSKTNTPAKPQTPAKKGPKYEIDMKKLPALIVLLIGIVILTVTIFSLDGRVKEHEATIAALNAKNAEYVTLVETAQAEAAAATAALAEKDAALADANSRIEAAEQALTQILELINGMTADVAE